MSSEPEPPVSPSVAARARDYASAFATSIGAARTEIVIVAAITLIAAVLRLWDIGAVPFGLHGDEAWTGLDARSIKQNGWIGPYNLHALGQPIGPLYFTALLFRFLPEDVTTIRLSMAFWGILTIPLTYLTFRSMFDRTTATFAAVMLAIMTWHFHLSRTGFMVTTWPLVQMLALWLLWLAIKRSNGWLYAAAGLVAGLGVYTYNAYLVFLPVLFVPIAWAFMSAQTRRRRLQIVGGAALACGAGLLAAWPLIDYARDNSYVYRYHQKVVGVTYSDRWEHGSFADRADMLWDRGVEWGSAIAVGNRGDLGDGLATPGQPVVDPVMLSLALAGALMALWSAKRAEYATVLAAFPLLLLGALLTVLDGLFRRTFGMTPFIALLAALPLAWFWRRIVARNDTTGYAMAAALLGCIAIVGAGNARNYFGPVQESFAITYTYPYQLGEASQYLKTLPEDTEVYFYSQRWRFAYETRQFIAPGYVGVDRSREYRVPSDLTSPVNISVGRSRRLVFLLLGPYVQEFDAIAAKYPGGVSAEGRRRGEILFRAYYLEPQTAP